MAKKSSWDKWVDKYNDDVQDRYVKGKLAMAELDKFASKRDASGGRVWTVGDMQRYFNRKKK